MHNMINCTFCMQWWELCLHLYTPTNNYNWPGTLKKWSQKLDNQSVVKALWLDRWESNSIALCKNNNQKTLVRLPIYLKAKITRWSHAMNVRECLSYLFNHHRINVLVTRIILNNVLLLITAPFCLAMCIVAVRVPTICLTWVYSATFSYPVVQAVSFQALEYCYTQTRRTKWNSLSLNSIRIKNVQPKLRCKQQRPKLPIAVEQNILVFL